MVYSILQKLFNYSRNNKPKDFEKLITSIFANVRFLIKRLQLAIIPTQDIWNSIVIIMVFNSLYNNFKATTTSMLEHKNKIIKEISRILALTEVKLLSKCMTGITGDLAMTNHEKSQS